MRKIYLIRHGKPVFNGPRVCLGQTCDPSIEDRYKEMACGLAEYFKDKQIANYYCTPLIRTQQTLRSIIGKDREYTVLPGIIEAHYGNWEGVDIRLLTPSYGQGYIDACRGVTYPGIPDIGTPEPVKDAAQRAYDTIVNKTKGNSLIVAHTTITSLLCSKLMGLDWTEYQQLQIPYLSITELEENDGVLRLVEYGKDYLGTGER